MHFQSDDCLIILTHLFSSFLRLTQRAVLIWEDVSIVDYNRSGVPLIEIVSEPDMRSADEVIAYLETLRQTIQYLGASSLERIA